MTLADTLYMVHRRLQQISRRRFIMIVGALNVLVSLLSSLGLSLLNQDLPMPEMLRELPLWGIFVVSVLFVPLIETLIFQFAIIEGMAYYLGRNSKWEPWAVTVSALLFGLSHNYSLAYMAYATTLGIFLALTFLLARYRGDVSPVWLVLGIHALINLLAFVSNEML